MKYKKKDGDFYDRFVETMSLSEREKYLNRRLRETIRHACEHAPSVREWFNQTNIDPSQIKKISDLEKLPIMKKNDLIEFQKKKPPFGGFLGKPFKDIGRIFVSPGPLYEPMLKDVKSITLKALYAGGFREGDRVIVTFSYHLVPAGLGFDEALRELGAIVIPTGIGNTELQVQILYDTKANGFVGTPSFLNALIQKSEELGRDFRRDFNLDHAMVGAEMLSSDLRKRFEEGYGIRISQTYGTADVGFVAYECREKSGMHLSDDSVIEFVDSLTGRHVGPGDVGEIVVTSFSKVYPLIRFATGDLSSYTNNPCPCGRTSNRLVKILGRVGDSYKVRGMFIHARQLNEMFSKFSEISNYQIILDRVEHKDIIRCELEIKSEKLEEKDKIVDEIERTFKDVCRVRIDQVVLLPGGTIPQEKKTIIDKRVW
jgi:phenylacetate-CoA ligase